LDPELRCSFVISLWFRMSKRSWRSTGRGGSSSIRTHSLPFDQYKFTRDEGRPTEVVLLNYRWCEVWVHCFVVSRKPSSGSSIDDSRRSKIS
ncbi:hypothetical protein KCU65_g247, partial [Aureobasidium melanogenum]